MIISVLASEMGFRADLDFAFIVFFRGLLADDTAEGLLQEFGGLHTLRAFDAMGDDLHISVWADDDLKFLFHFRANASFTILRAAAISWLDSRRARSGRSQAS